MATLEDKLLGEKLHYYCSSSEDEEDTPGSLSRAPPPPPAEANSTSNTGPKGVIKDWQRYKQLESEKREEAELEKLALAKKLSMTCKTAREEEEEKLREQKLDEELEDLFNDDFMQEYMQKRMEEMMKNTKNTKKFGEVIDLKNGSDFLDAIDLEEKSCSVVILIYQPEIPGCAAMQGCLRCLAKDHETVKFCQIVGSAAGLSNHFKVSGVPALLVYRAGLLLDSFVRLTDQFGEDFFADEVESFLVEHALLPNKEDTPRIIRGPTINPENDDE